MFELTDLLKMKVSELKAQLSKLGLNTKGNKIQLVHKLAEFFNLKCDSLTVGPAQAGEEVGSQLSNSETKPRKARKSTGTKSKIREPTAEDYTQACSRDLSVVLERIDPLVTAGMTNLRCSASNQNNVEALPEIASFLESPTFSSHLSSISVIDNSFPSISNVPANHDVVPDDNFTRIHSNFDHSLSGEGCLAKAELNSPVRLDDGDDDDDDAQEDEDHLFPSFHFRDKLHHNPMEDNCMMSFIESMQGLVIDNAEPNAQDRSSCMYEHSNCDKLFIPQTVVSYKNIDPMMNASDFNLGNEEYSYENTSDSFEAAKFCSYDSTEVVFDKIGSNVDVDTFSFGESLCHMTSGFQDPLLSYADQNSKQIPEDVFESSCSDLVPTAGYSDSLIDSDNDPLIEIDEEFIEESIICEEDGISFDEQEQISKQFFYDSHIENKLDLLPNEDLNDSIFDGTSNEEENMLSDSSKLLNNDFNSMMNISNSLNNSILSGNDAKDDSIDQILEPTPSFETPNQIILEESLIENNEGNLFDVLQREILISNSSHLNADILDSEVQNDGPGYLDAESLKHVDDELIDATSDSQVQSQSISIERASNEPRDDDEADDDDDVDDDNDQLVEKEVEEIDNSLSDPSEINSNLIDDIDITNQLQNSSVKNADIEISLVDSDNSPINMLEKSDDPSGNDDVECLQADRRDDVALEECTTSSAEELRAIDNDLIVLLDDDEILDTESVKRFSEDDNHIDAASEDPQLECNYEPLSSPFLNSSFLDAPEENLGGDENIEEIQANFDNDEAIESKNAPATTHNDLLDLFEPEVEIIVEKELNYSNNQIMLTSGALGQSDLDMEISTDAVEETHESIGIEFPMDEMPSLEISELSNDVIDIFDVVNNNNDDEIEDCCFESTALTSHNDLIRNDVLLYDYKEAMDDSIDLTEALNLGQIEAIDVSGSLINLEIDKIEEDVVPIVVQIMSVAECPNEIINDVDDVNESIITASSNGSYPKCIEDIENCATEVDEDILEPHSSEKGSEDAVFNEDIECDKNRHVANLIDQNEDVINDDRTCEANSDDVCPSEITSSIWVKCTTTIIKDDDKFVQETNATNNCESISLTSQCQDEDANFQCDGNDKMLLISHGNVKSSKIIPSEENANKLVAYESSFDSSDDDDDDDYALEGQDGIKSMEGENNVERKRDSKSKNAIDKVDSIESEDVVATNEIGLKGSHSIERPSKSCIELRDNHISSNKRNAKVSDCDGTKAESEDFDRAIKRKHHLSDTDPHRPRDSNSKRISRDLKSDQRSTRNSGSSSTRNLKSEDGAGNKRKRRNSRSSSSCSKSPRKSRDRNRPRRRSRSRSRSRYRERSRWNQGSRSGSHRDRNIGRDSQRHVTYNRDWNKYNRDRDSGPRKLHKQQRLETRSRDYSERSRSRSRKHPTKKFVTELEKKSRQISRGESPRDNRKRTEDVNLEHLTTDGSLIFSGKCTPSQMLRDMGDVHLDISTCDLNLEIDKDDFTCTPITNGELSFLWGNVRSNFGASKGRMCFQIKVLQKLNVDDNFLDELNPTHGVRVGFSFGFEPPHLGKSLLTYAYDSSGVLMCNDDVSMDGVEPFTCGDVITAYSDLTSDPYMISFSKNEKHFHSSFTIHPSSVQNLPIFPHIATRNCSFQVNFDGKSCEGRWFEVKDGFKMIGNMKDEELVCHSPPLNREESKVLLMCGLPGSGKTYWVRNFLKDKNPKEFFTILCDIFILNKMEVNDYTDKWRQIANRCIHKLLTRCSQIPRNYVLDQTNVYKNARKKKLEYFKGFKCKFVVMVTGDAEYERRCGERKREGKFLPAVVLSEMKRNFKLPKRSDACEVEFVGEKEDEVKKIVRSYNRQGSSYYVQHLKHQRQKRSDKTKSRVPSSAAASEIQDSIAKSLSELAAGWISVASISSTNLNNSYSTCKIQSSTSSSTSMHQMHASTSKVSSLSSSTKKSSPSASKPSDIKTNSDKIIEPPQIQRELKEGPKIKIVSKSLSRLSSYKSNAKSVSTPSSTKSSVTNERQSKQVDKNSFSFSKSQTIPLTTPSKQPSNSDVDIVATSACSPIIISIQNLSKTSANLPTSLNDSINISQASSSSSPLPPSTSSSSPSLSTSTTTLTTLPHTTSNDLMNSANVVFPENFKELMQYPPPSYYQNPSMDYYNQYAVYSAYQYPYYGMQCQQYYNCQYPAITFQDQMLQQNFQDPQYPSQQQFNFPPQQQQWFQPTDNISQHPFTNASSLQKVSSQSSIQKHSSSSLSIVPYSSSSSSAPSSSSSPSPSTSTASASSSSSIIRTDQIKCQMSLQKTPVDTKSRVDASISRTGINNTSINNSINTFNNVQPAQSRPNHDNTAQMKQQPNQKRPPNQPPVSTNQSGPSQQQSPQTSLKCSTNDFWQLAIFNDSKRDNSFSQYLDSTYDSKKRKGDNNQDSGEPTKKARPLNNPVTSCCISSSATSTNPRTSLSTQSSSYSSSPFKSWPSSTLASNSNDRGIYHSNRTPFRPNVHASNDGNYAFQRDEFFESNYDVHPKIAANNNRFPSKGIAEQKPNQSYHENRIRPRNIQQPNNKRFSNPQSFHRNDSNSQDLRFRPRFQDPSSFPFQENYMCDQAYSNRHGNSQGYLEELNYYERGYNCPPRMLNEPPFRPNRPDCRPSNRRFPNSNTGMRMDMHADKQCRNNDPWY